MLIANPIYDTIFKFLMDDNESAKIILSTLLNVDIEELTATTTIQSYLGEDEKNWGFGKLSHLDYAAQVLKPDGSKENILIELQKADLPSDFYRFRLYITEKFKKSHSTIKKENTTIHTPLKFIPIFILNFEIENEICDLVIQTNKMVKGVLKDTILQNPVSFLDDLMYDLTIVQIPHITNIDVEKIKDDAHKLELYKLFKLFDQNAKTQNDDYKLEIKEKIPSKYTRLVKRLQHEHLNSFEIKNQLIEEDTRILDIKNMLNQKIQFQKTIEEKEKTIEENTKTIEEKEKTIEKIEKNIEEKEKTIEEKEKTIEEKEKTIEEKEKTIEEKEKTIEEKEKTIINSIFLLSRLKLTVNEIADNLDVSIDFVKQVLKN